jgi:hypothetical protein
MASPAISPVRSTRCAGKDLAADAPQHLQPHAPSQRHRLCRMGAGPRPPGLARLRHHQHRSLRRAPCWRPIRGTRTSARRVAFADMRGMQTDWTGDRSEFIGRNGKMSSPAALLSSRPFSRPQAPDSTLAACCALGRARPQFKCGGGVPSGPGRTCRGGPRSSTRYRSANLDAVQADVAAHWQRMLGSVQVKTPDRAMDIMLNGWLMYQTIACRLWARSGFYQSSGAYGFRDQLQDGMALAAVQPAMTRAICCGRRHASSGRRRSALVAAAFRPGGAHPHLG